MQFVSKPLADLVQEMKNNNQDTEFLKKIFPITATHFNNEYLDLVTEKCIYPYEYFTNFKQFNLQLTDISEFDKNTSDLNEPTSQKQYDFAQEVYKRKLIAKISMSIMIYIFIQMYYY